MAPSQTATAQPQQWPQVVCGAEAPQPPAPRRPRTACIVAPDTILLHRQGRTVRADSGARWESKSALSGSGCRPQVVVDAVAGCGCNQHSVEIYQTASQSDLSSVHIAKFVYEIRVYISYNTPPVIKTEPSELRYVPRPVWINADASGLPILEPVK